MRNCIAIFAVSLLATAAFGQKWEVGASAGASVFTVKTIKGPAAGADAGFNRGWALSTWLGNDTSDRIGGEIHYTYERNSARLRSGTAAYNFAAHSQSIYYDFLFYFTPRKSKVRPFLAAGAGIRRYEGTGREVAAQPLGNFAFLTATNETKPLASVGMGIKVAAGKNVNFKFEFRDFLTPMPTKVIAPAPGASLGGWIQNFVVMAGLAYVF